MMTEIPLEALVLLELWSYLPVSWYLSRLVFMSKELMLCCVGVGKQKTDSCTVVLMEILCR